MDKRDLVDRFVFAQFVEACRCLEEGIASANDIDLAMRAGAGLKQGPLTWADSAGMDTVLARLKSLSAMHGERFTPPRSLEQMVADDRLGIKTGRGFFEYSAE
ncbi:MAG: 3-hydroxyacyl-CoA dehydrogenase [Chloroflexi bacterium]|nr:3-hydroxyacyl-CoA dehydrogenase [Chloroflexota bacterium]